MSAKNIDMIEPLPPEMPRTINLLPLVSILQGLERDVNIGYFDGSASMALNITTRDVIENRDHDIQITRDQTNPLKQRIEYKPGSINNITDFRSLKTLSHIYTEFMDLTAAIMPEIVLHDSFPIIPMPNLEDEYHTLDGLDGLGYYEKGQGNYYKFQKRRYGLMGTRNPAVIIKEHMIERGMWNVIYSKRIRSVQKLQTILGIDPDRNHRGWQSMIIKPEFLMKDSVPTSGIRFPPIMSEICDARIKDKWWLDKGIPKRFLTATDGTQIEGIIYFLTKSGYSIPAA